MTQKKDQESQLQNADLMKDEMEEISWAEAHGVLGDDDKEDPDEEDDTPNGKEPDDEDEI